MKNSNDTIGNRIRDFPTCSAVPQPTALPRAPYTVWVGILIQWLAFGNILVTLYSYVALIAIGI